MTNCFTIFYNFTKYVRNVIFLKKIQMLEFSIYARLAEYKELTVFNSLGLLTSEIRHRAKLFLLFIILLFIIFLFGNKEIVTKCHKRQFSNPYIYTT